MHWLTFYYRIFMKNNLKALFLSVAISGALFASDGVPCLGYYSDAVPSLAGHGTTTASVAVQIAPIAQDDATNLQTKLATLQNQLIEIDGKIANDQQAHITLTRELDSLIGQEREDAFGSIILRKNNDLMKLANTLQELNSQKSVLQQQFIDAMQSFDSELEENRNS